MTDIDFWRNCADVQVDPQKLHGEPTVGPFRVAVRTVIESEQLGGTAEEIADDYSLPLDKVRSILAFYHAHMSEFASSH